MRYDTEHKERTRKRVLREAANADPARQRFFEGGDRMTKLVAMLLKRQGIANAHDLALSIVSEMVGAVALSRAMTKPARSNRILKASRNAIKARIADRRGAAQ